MFIFSIFGPRLRMSLSCETLHLSVLWTQSCTQIKLEWGSFGSVIAKTLNTMTRQRACLIPILISSFIGSFSTAASVSDSEQMVDLIKAGNAAIKQTSGAGTCPATMKASHAVTSGRSAEETSPGDSPGGFGAIIKKSCRIGTRGFGQKKHPILGTMRMHWGQDIPAPNGTPVYAPADGQVLSQRTAGGYGKQVIMKLANGYTIELNHLSRYGTKGKVQRGQIIAYVGSTGMSTGPHLHLGVRNKAGKFIDPKKLFRPAEMCNK